MPKKLLIITVVVSVVLSILVLTCCTWSFFELRRDVWGTSRSVEPYSQTGEGLQELNSLNVSHWNTYRNEEYGFEIQYPMEWAVRREDNDTFLGSNDSERVVPLLRLTVEKNEDIKEWVRDLRNDKPSSYKKIISQEDYNVGGNDGVKIIYSTDIGLNEEVVLVRIGNGNLVVFSFPNENGISPYYEKVIQTFQLNP